MSTMRFGKKWADVDEDDEEAADSPKAGQARFETPVDKDGIKTVIEYIERDGKTYKVSTRVKTKTVTHWSNKQIADRKNMNKFGKVVQHAEAPPTRSEEEIHIEMSRNPATQVSTKDDAEDKFYEESLTMADSLSKVKKAWGDMNRDRQLERDREGVISGGAAAEDKDKPEEKAEGAAGGAQPTKYLPPSIRNRTEAGKGGGKGPGDMQQQQEASLRVHNLSEDVREGDLQDLFGQCGRLQRVHLVKDKDTGASRGFAFVTYYNKEDAQRAIDKLNGHGYDNLILQVQFAKPKT